jgi:V8-like Glu-specific endopeptidase
MKTFRLIVLGLFLVAGMFLVGGNTFTQDTSPSPGDDPIEIIKNAKTPVNLHSLAGGKVCIPGISDSLVHLRPSQICSWWESVYPPSTFGARYHVDNELLNAVPGLDTCDWLNLHHYWPNGDPGGTVWVHVEDVTITLILTRTTPPYDTMYVEFERSYKDVGSDFVPFAIYPPVECDTLHEVWPYYCHHYHLTGWIDSGLPYGQLSCSDSIDLLEVINPKYGAVKWSIPSSPSEDKPQGKGSSQICGFNSQIPIMAAPQTWRNFRKPVAMIVVHYTGVDSVGTGFLYDNCCLVTAAHVIRSAPAPGNVEIWFGYEDTTPPYQSGDCTPDVWECCSLKVNPDGYDVGVVYIKQKNGKCPGTSGYGIFQISGIGPQQGWGVHIIGHPGGRCKEYSHDDYATVISNGVDPNCDGGAGEWSHGADTEGGSSGSPVIDDAGKIIGVHTAMDGNTPCKNCFVPTASVCNWLLGQKPCPCQGTQPPPPAGWYVQDVAIDIEVLSGPYPQTPTMTQWGMIVLVALIIASAVYIMLRRRRVTVPA